MKNVIHTVFNPGVLARIMAWTIDANNDGIFEMAEALANCLANLMRVKTVYKIFSRGEKPLDSADAKRIVPARETFLIKRGTANVALAKTRAGWI